MTSPIRSTEQDGRMTAAEMPASETDSIPRIKIRDLMAAALFLSRNQESTLDALRVKLNTDRRAHASRTAGYSVARDVAAELDRLGLADVGLYPKMPRDSRRSETPSSG